MGITLTLPVPLKSQLGEVTSDGQVNENDHYNCVATSIADGLQYRLKRAFNGDALKDAVYGQGYQGGQAAIRYVAYCANLGVPLEAINGSQDQLIAALHREIEAGNPCLITMPSLWGSAPSQPGWDPRNPSGWTHVGLASGDGPGWLRIMNPWGGFWHDGTDDYWRLRLCYGQIWRVGPVRSVTMAWHVGADGWGTDDKGHRVGPGIVTGLQAAGWMGTNAAANETPYDAIGSMYVALENHHTVEWSKAGGATTDQAGPALIAQRAEIDDLRRQLAAAQAGSHATPLTPYQLACIAAAEAGMTATSALASATALRGK